jgi:hypothetical protein
LLLGTLTQGAQAQANRITTSPAEFVQMVMYGDYRRGSGGGLAHAPETIEIAKSGLPLPPGTRLVLEIYNDNALTDYFLRRPVGENADQPADLREDKPSLIRREQLGGR